MTMLKRIRAGSHVKGPSFAFLLLPYFCIAFFSIVGASSFSGWLFVLYYLLTVAAGFLFLRGYSWAGDKKIRWLFWLSYLSVLIFFYGDFVYRPLQSVVFYLSSVYIKGRLLFSILFLCLIPLFLVKKVFVYLNRFCIILTVVVMITGISRLLNTKKNAKENPVPITQLRSVETDTAVTHKNNTVVLIILDEYSADDPVFEQTNHGSLLKKLAAEGWITKPFFQSNEISTPISIASIFNYNLTDYFQTDKSSAFADMSNVANAGRKLVESKLVKYLRRKKVGFQNISFFDIDTSKATIRTLPLPRTFAELFLLNSLYFDAVTGIGAFNLRTDGFPGVEINGYNNNVLVKAAACFDNPQPGEFVYLHLLMPHFPFYFSPVNYAYPASFKFTSNTATSYYAYRNFINGLMAGLLLKKPFPPFLKVIVTGDHGYRAASENRRITSAAFYGFTAEEVQKVSVVQDLGFLINTAF